MKSNFRWFARKIASFEKMRDKTVLPVNDLWALVPGLIFDFLCSLACIFLFDSHDIDSGHFSPKIPYRTFRRKGFYSVLRMIPERHIHASTYSLLMTANHSLSR